MQSANATRAFVLLAILGGCHAGSQPESLGPVSAKSRQEGALTSALRWIPTSSSFRGLPVVLMAGSAHGAYRDQWIDSLQAAKIIHHDCTAQTVEECPDNIRSAYVGFEQPHLGDGRSAQVTMTIVVMNPATCNRDATPYREVTGQLLIPVLAGETGAYQWTEKESVEHHC